MKRRAFLSTSLLAAPALLSVSSLPASAASTGSTLLEAPGLSASGSFTIPGFGASGNGRLTMDFTDGPSVQAQFGPAAVAGIIGASAGSRIGIRYEGLNGADTYLTRMTLNNATPGGATADFAVDGGLSASISALVGGDQDAGAGLAAMIVAALSAGAVFRGTASGELQALVATRPTPSGADFGLDVTVRAA